MAKKYLKNLVRGVAARAGVTQDVAYGVMLALIEEMWLVLKQPGGRVVIVGFGTFETKLRAGKRYRHPQTGEILRAEDSAVVTFKLGKGRILEDPDISDAVSPTT